MDINQREITWRWLSPHSHHGLIQQTGVVVGAPQQQQQQQLQVRHFTKDLINHPEGTVFKGEDFYGNRYYEAPRDNDGKYLKYRRWMEPAQAAEVSDEEFEKLRKE